MDLQQHYKAQANMSFWTRPRNAAMSREVGSYSLARLNELYHLNANSKAEAVRRILYDGGFLYDGILPAGALHGDPQFSSFYDSGSVVTAYSVLREHLERDVKPRGYDCTGRRQKSLYLQALAGNKKAKESLDTAYHGDFPSRPVDAWVAIEEILHGIYADYLKHYGCPDRVLNHPMYPAISPPLPNPVKLQGYILRARRARDTVTLSWMLGRDIAPNELLAENSERLVQSVITRFGYTLTEPVVGQTIYVRDKKPYWQSSGVVPLTVTKVGRIYYYVGFMNEATGRFDSERRFRIVDNTEEVETGSSRRAFFSEQEFAGT